MVLRLTDSHTSLSQKHFTCLCLLKGEEINAQTSKTILQQEEVSSHCQPARGAAAVAAPSTEGSVMPLGLLRTWSAGQKCSQLTVAASLIPNPTHLLQDQRKEPHGCNSSSVEDGISARISQLLFQAMNHLETSSRSTNGCSHRTAEPQWVSHSTPAQTRRENLESSLGLIRSECSM